MAMVSVFWSPVDPVFVGSSDVEQAVEGQDGDDADSRRGCTAL